MKEKEMVKKWANFLYDEFCTRLEKKTNNGMFDPDSLLKTLNEMKKFTVEKLEEFPEEGFFITQATFIVTQSIESAMNDLENLIETKNTSFN